MPDFEQARGLQYAAESRAERELATIREIAGALDGLTARLTELQSTLDSDAFADRVAAALVRRAVLGGVR